MLALGKSGMVAVFVSPEMLIGATPLFQEDPPRGAALADPNAASALPPVQASSSAMVILAGSFVLVVVVMVLLARAIFPGSFGGGAWNGSPRNSGRTSGLRRSLSTLEWTPNRKEVIHDAEYLSKITEDEADLPDNDKS